jgi:ABC-type uncharacterized transport system substrate-binding protein
MDRRAFIIIVIGNILGAPRTTEAQQRARVYRIGVFHLASPEASLGFPALREGLRDLGYVDGKDIVFEYRWPEGQAGRLPALAADLVRLNLDVIVTGDTTTTMAAKRATGEIPIIFAVSFDAVGEGLVASLARPGGNATGISIFAKEFSGKRLELLKEILPHVSRIALLWHPTLPHHQALLHATEEAARQISVTLQRVQTSGTPDIEKAFQVAVKGRAGAVLALPAVEFAIMRGRIAELGLKYRLPTMTHEPGFAKEGGLVQYGPSVVEAWRRAASYVDKILKGAKPADLPVEQPTKFELVINMKTAKAINLTIPPSVLGRADQVIE